jgi:hypothetical protein
VLERKTPWTFEPQEATMADDIPNSVVPLPDPSVITTARLDDAKADLRREQGAQRELLLTRLDCIEETQGLLRAAIERLPEERQEQAQLLQRELDRRIVVLDKADAETRDEILTSIEHLHKLHEERFASIAQQFQERDTRSDQDKKSSKEALDAALLAQKESVSQQNDANTTAATKSETSFTKQIDQIGTLIATLEKSLTDRITELKERIDRGEGTGQGVRQANDDRHGLIGSTTSILLVIAAFLSILVVAAVATHGFTA